MVFLWLHGMAPQTSRALQRFTMGKKNVLVRNKKNQAIQLFQSQQLPEATALLEEISKRDRTDFEMLCMLGSCYAQTGRLQDAERVLLQSIKLKPDYFLAYENLGMTQFMLGKKSVAIKTLRKSVAIEPGYYFGFYNLGNALRDTEATDEAIDAYRSVIRLKPDFSDAHINLGTLYYTKGENDLAVEHFNRALSLKPEQAGIYRNLYKAYYKKGDLMKAVDSCSKLIQLEPENEENYLKLAIMRNDQGFDEETVKLCTRAIELNADYSEAYDLLAVSHIARGELEPAAGIYEKLATMTQDPKNEVRVLIGFASIEIKKGNYMEAYKRLAELNEKGRLTPHGAFLLGFISKHTGEQEEAIKVMKEMIDNNTAVYVNDLRHLHFGLADVYDETGDYDSAFEHYSLANSMSPNVHDAGNLVRTTTELIETVTRPHLAECQHTEIDQRPVFIVGMNRSGTSLTEQILSSHPEVYGAGELEMVVNLGKSLSSDKNTSDGQLYPLDKISATFINDEAEEYLRVTRKQSGGARVITDKMPHNFWHLPLISMMFPKAIIIHCTRNPLDTCLSNFFQDFGGKHQYTSDLGDLCNYYIQYSRIMQHWSEVLDLDIMEVNYETLVANQEHISREMIDHLGLEWDDACLQFHKSQRLVTTASQDQVKQPLYRKSIARWRNYEKHIQDLIRRFDEAGIEYQ